MTACTAAVALIVTPAAAVGQPALPDDASEAEQQLTRLSREAERLTEQWHRAQDRLEDARAQLQRSKATAADARRARARARAHQQRFRTQVDRFTRLSLRGARLNRLSAVISSSSPGEFVDRMAALEMLAADNRQAMRRLSAAVTGARRAAQRAEAATERAAQAKQRAVRVAADRERARQDMKRQIAQVRQRLDELTAAQRDSYAAGGVTDFVLGSAPAGAATNAVQAALNQQGEPYTWAAEGPNRFDCSGLMVFAYRKAALDLPRSSSQQARVGRPVSRSELQPGDLIALYSPVSHIGMYVGEGKYVHAPQPGDVVEVVPVPWDKVTAMRRVT